MENFDGYRKQLKENESDRLKNYFVLYKGGSNELIKDCISIVRYHPDKKKFGHINLDPVFVEDKDVPTLLEETREKKGGQIFFQMSRNLVRPVEASKIENILCPSDADVSCP